MMATLLHSMSASSMWWVVSKQQRFDEPLNTARTVSQKNRRDAGSNAVDGSSIRTTRGPPSMLIMYVSCQQTCIDKHAWLGCYGAFCGLFTLCPLPLSLQVLHIAENILTYCKYSSLTSQHSVMHWPWHLTSQPQNGKKSMNIYLNMSFYKLLNC